MEGKLRSMSSVFLTKGDRICLLYRQGSRVVNDVWIGTAGGHFEEYEIGDAKACALRELQEETGLKETQIEDLKLQYLLVRNNGRELRLNYYFFTALTDDSLGEDFVPASEEGICRWFHKDEVAELPMPASTKEAVLHWFREGRITKKLYAGLRVGENIQFSELPET